MTREPNSLCVYLQEKYYVDFVEFYTNGFVLVGIIFITATFSNTLLQGHFHLTIRDGIRAKMALQVQYINAETCLPNL